jgi:type II restriction enzyme
LTWKSELTLYIQEHWRPGQEFTLPQVYNGEDSFSRAHPGNRHVRDKLRQTLQYLRDEGLIAFVDESGTYLRLR